ncbi:MAG TPA: PepSY-associated TM helix domain-containing protein [Tahibacter sp.]|uniref:PepSY-associated TM helix domain-containing protein n=1 Tax=Tahibacter sp. TaxID=2056211 RepID=UPI002B9EB3D3|nr:PepSY-associated TM helix domain-containing protein [Tahibacter sp.]HSX59824.1 PepSY-associated TM helix domain-containing protein [Tahibacter sp.]
MAISQRTLRRWHAWMAWTVGLQVVLWVVSGVYMTAAPIDWIHGDHWVRADDRALPAPGSILVTPAQLQQRFPAIERFTLKPLFGKPVYEVHHGASIALVDAATGTPLLPLDAGAVRALAQARFAGTARISAVTWLETAPQEVATRPAPLWRVDFDHVSAPALYYSPFTGELLAKRFAGWRAFDALWMLHIMDYDTREDVNNVVLRVAAGLALVFAISGAALLVAARRRAPAALRGRLPPRPWPYRIHRLLAWIVGAQLLLWIASGLTMSLLDQRVVEGQHYRRSPAPAAIDLSAVVAPESLIAAQGARVRAVEFRTAIDGPVYIVRSDAGDRRYGARSGQPQPVDAALARAIAKADYAGPGTVQAAQRLGGPDLETRNHSGSLWRVPVADDIDTTLYVSAVTGDVLERRNRVWRIFDVAWMLHIMDYRERRNFNHPLLVAMAFGAACFAGAGVVLLARRRRRDSRRPVAA